MSKNMLKKLIPKRIKIIKNHLKNRFWNWLIRNKILKSIAIVIVRSIIKSRYEAAINFYSRYNLAKSGSILKDYFSWVIFYAVIDPQVRSNPKAFNKYKNLLFKDASAKMWSDGFADIYDAYLKDGKSSCLTAILSLIKSKGKNDWRLLDLGCGTGNCIKILCDIIGDKIKVADGIDFSKDAIEYAKSRFDLKKHTFICNDILQWLQTLPDYQDWQYDIAFSNLVLQLFDEYYILNMYRLLKQKKICKSIYISDSYCDIKVDLSTAPSSVYNPDNFGYLRFDHNHQKLLTQSGYRNVRIIGDYRCPANLLTVVTGDANE